jgi:hypothetical protein
MMHNEIAPGERESSCFARISSGIRILMLVTFLFMGLKIIRYGCLPPGDVLRDAAQAITGKPFADVIVMFPGYTMNHNPGWDWFLRQLHVKAGLSEDQLVAFSIVSMLLCLLCFPLPWFRCPEAWLATLLVFNLALPWLMSRFTQARPLLLTEGVLIALLLAWRKGEDPSWPKIILTCAGFTLAVWMHGTWFLWALLPAAFFLARQWRAGISLTLCWVAGTLLGAMLTGHPFESLRQSIVIAVTVSREHVPAMLTVGELQSSEGEFTVLLILGIMFIWRQGKLDQLFRSPLFWMMVICWLLGLTAGRFWVDWGLPAALVWMALQIEEVFLAAWAARPPGRRLLVSGLMALSLFLLTTSDAEGRYTNMLREPFTDLSVPELKGWAPEKGGIFYGADMSFFYNTFYKNPEGDWQYIVGFEPAWMPPDDLKIYRTIQWSQFAYEAYQPWVRKMRPQDRLEISSTTRPNVPPLEWINAGSDIWIGRPPKNLPSNQNRAK